MADDTKTTKAVDSDTVTLTQAQLDELAGTIRAQVLAEIDQEPPAGRQSSSGIPVGETRPAGEGRVWGPVTEYTYFNTQYGEFVLHNRHATDGFVLTFVEVYTWDDKESRFRWVIQPRYRVATDEEKEAVNWSKPDLTPEAHQKRAVARTAAG